jgi:uncharacterized linocin/CFP29 family protein
MDPASTLPWSGDQWAMLQKLVQDSAQKVKVAASFLPLTGPLPPGQQYVPAGTITVSPGAAPQPLQIDGVTTLPLVTISSGVKLTAGQVSDPHLAAARQELSLVGNVLGRLEDEIIFSGLVAAAGAGKWVRLYGTTKAKPAPLQTRPEIYTVDGNDQDCAGLLTVPVGATKFGTAPAGGGAPAQPAPVELVRAIVEAITDLETKGYPGPVACVLGGDLFLEAVTPSASMVLPKESIVPFLGGGPFLRSAYVPRDHGCIVSLGASALDLVVGSALQMEYLGRQGTDHVLSVSETFKLRIQYEEEDGPVRVIQRD